MKKRNGESISPPLSDSKKLNHTFNGGESSKQNGVKKSKLNMKEGPSGKAICGPITKDEEEVVETLYALAGMFPSSGTPDQSKLCGESSQAKSSALWEAEQSSTPALGVSRRDLDSTCPSTTAEAANPASNPERSLPAETVRVSSSNDACVLEHTNLANGKQFGMDSDGSAPQANLQKMPTFSKSEYTEEKPLHNSINCGVSYGLSLETRLKQPKQQEASLFDRKTEIAFGLATSFGSQPEQQRTIKESKINGLALWPGLSSAVSHGGGIHSPSLQPSAAKIPPWLDTAACATRSTSSEHGVSTEKVSRITVDRKSWKRCTAHVYISRLIQVLKISEGRDRLPMLPDQLRPNEGFKDSIIMAANHLNGVRNDLNGALLAGSIGGSTAEKNLNETQNGDGLQLRRLHLDQQRSASASGGSTLQKQSFDFLSLSAGNSGVEGNNTNRAGNGLEPLSQFPVPYLHSLTQHHTLIPLSLPQTRHSYAPYADQLSAATAAQQVQLQLPPYLGSSFCGPSLMNPPASTKQQQPQQPQHQQQQIWAAQLAAQYRAGSSAPIAQFSSWQNGRQESSSLTQCAQAIIPPSASSLEVLGPKYIPISPQQQQLLAIASSLPPARAKRQHQHLPSGYEDNGGGFRSDAALPIQLLCNEQL